MDAALAEAARRALGFMPEPEGLALYEAAVAAAPLGPVLEIGSYCGKSTIYLAAAARLAGGIVYTIDHHRGSEEHQPGQEYHEPDLVDSTGRIDTLHELRRTIAAAGIDDVVVAIVGSSATVAAHWATPLGMVFIDGGHSLESATADYEGWAPRVVTGGTLAIHDVFEDPTEGGRSPFDIYRRALASEEFEETSRAGSLRILRARRSDPPS